MVCAIKLYWLGKGDRVGPRKVQGYRVEDRRIPVVVVGDVQHLSFYCAFYVADSPAFVECCIVSCVFNRIS